MLDFGQSFGRCKVDLREHRPPAGSASETLDVAAGGGLFDAFGQEVNFDTVPFLFFFNRITNTAAMRFGRGASGGVKFFSSDGESMLIPKGGFALFYAGAAATRYDAGAGNSTIEIANLGGSSADYDIIIIGRRI